LNDRLKKQSFIFALKIIQKDGVKREVKNGDTAKSRESDRIKVSA
jgi:hypothetical protein